MRCARRSQTSCVRIRQVVCTARVVTNSICHRVSSGQCNRRAKQRSRRNVGRLTARCSPSFSSTSSSSSCESSWDPGCEAAVTASISTTNSEKSKSCELSMSSLLLQHTPFRLARSRQKGLLRLQQLPEVRRVHLLAARLHEFHKLFRIDPAAAIQIDLLKRLFESGKLNLACASDPIASQCRAWSKVARLRGAAHGGARCAACGASAWPAPCSPPQASPAPPS